MFGLLVLMLCIEFAKAGVLCSTRQMNWTESINSCSKLNGAHVTIDAKNEDFYKQQLNGHYEVWASSHTYYDNCSNGQDVCGYSLIEGFPPVFSNELRYGDCEITRNYVCGHYSVPFAVLRSNYKEAIKCKYPPPFNVLTKMHLPRGYYWKPNKSTICQRSGNNNNLIQSGALCMVYDNSDGLFYVGCESQRHIICNFDQNFHHSGYEECIGGSYLSTNPTQRSSLLASISTSITQRSTDKITSTIKPSTSKQLSSVITTKRQTHKVPDIITETSVTSGTGDVNGVTPTPISHAHETQEEQKGQQAENNLGVNVGVPVASCVVLFGVVIFVVYMCRRYKRDGGTTKREDYVDGQLRSMSNTNQLQPSNVITVTNETYTNSANDDTVEDEYAYIGTDQDMNTQSYERSCHSGMRNNGFENEYSYSSDLHDQCEDGQYDTTTDLKRQQNKASDDYDRIQINKAFDRYGVNESELYDTSATNQRRPHCNSPDDYDHINVKRSDSVDVYDTTRPVRPVNESTGDIYNQLDENDKEGTYDKTSHQQTLLMRPVVNDDMFA